MHVGSFTLILCGVLVTGRPVFAQGIASGAARTAPKSAPSGRPFPVKLTDIAAAASVLTPLTYGGETRKKYIVEANGAGLALLDYDGDGWTDIFLLNGSRLGSPAGPQPTTRVYKNLGGWKFEDATKRAGVDRSGWANGVCAGDIDNDGHPDLYLTYWGVNSLYRNQSDGSFDDIAKASGTAGAGSAWSTGCAFLDYDRDGRQDLFVTSYAGFELRSAPLPGQFPFCMWKGAPVFCGPRGLPHGTNTLYRNRGDGTFEDVSEKSGVAAVPGCYGFTATAADLDRDGWLDIYVACDSTPSVLLRNHRDGTFQELGTESGLAFNENGSEQAGMGIALADFDGDGRIDITKTNFSGDYPNLYRNLGKMVFTDVPVRAGLGVNPGYVLWGTGFADFDNDGFFDLFQVAGHVYPDAAKIDSREAYAQPRLLYRNLGGGTFEDVSAIAGPAMKVKASSRGAAFADLDNDGDMDVVIANMHQPPSVLRNDVTGNAHWLKVQLKPVAVGATVSVGVGGRVFAQPLLSQSSFLSHNGLTLHFGLGESAAYEWIEVAWPSGKVERFDGGTANRTVTPVEGQ